MSTLTNNESVSYNIEGDHPDWVLVSEVDESEPYETDVTQVWRTPTGYAYAWATGCSCWDGDYSITEFSSLEHLALYLFSETKDYTPGLKRALTMVGTAWEARESKAVKL